jgi:hypothetical protein
MTTREANKQRPFLGKVPAATNAHETVDLLYEIVFCIRSLQRRYKKDNWGDPVGR